MGQTELLNLLKPKHLFTSRPGRVGSVGDTIVKTRFRQSTPTMPWAYDPYWTGDRADKLGSNVQDGDTVGYDNHGGAARTIDSKWNGFRGFKVGNVTSYHDIPSIDKMHEPTFTWSGDYSWRNKLARSRIAKRNGTLFSIMPQGYSPDQSDLLRGGNYPITETVGGEGLETDGNMQQDIVVTGVNPTPGTQTNPINAGISKFGPQEITTYTPRFFNKR